MCGIVAYIGSKPAYPILINGLKRLEYRGYDSAGIATLADDSLTISKKKGKVSDLEKSLSGNGPSSTIGMGHTRWATHGEPNDINAHPHLSQNKKLAVIHNGIIENYRSLKTELTNKGYKFNSETDTEVFINFLEDIQKTHDLPLEEALRVALSKVVGAYAIVVISQEDPDTLYAARKGSPMVIGVGDGEYFIASDATPIVEYTKEVIYLQDEEVAIVKRNQLVITDLKDITKEYKVHQIDIALEEIEKGGYEHFMLKEIMEQPKSIADCMRGRLNSKEKMITLGGINEYVDQLINADKITFIACGTSWHAGLVAGYLFEEFCRIPVDVQYASEFRYRNPVIKKGDIVVAVSQSGETADTLAAIELAKSQGAIVLGIVNGVGSSIARATHEGAYLHAGPEIGVASTKAFTAQLTVLSMIAIKGGLLKGTITKRRFEELVAELDSIPAKVKKALELDDKIKVIAKEFMDSTNFLYLGRGYNFPVALEGALKLKEISYIHAEGYPAAEMKHGPIALIDENMPVVFIATRDSSYDKIISNIQEVRSRKGKVIAVVTEGDVLIPSMANYTLEVPATDQALMPLVSVIPLQLLSYHIALMRGANVDQPRNLAKSVTVE